MLDFLKLPFEERIVYFGEVASRRGLRRLIVEKDFWVCSILFQIFDNPDLKEKFILKGGTSLSKVFKLTYRFSEDIDLSVDPNWLGLGGDNRPDMAPSKSQFNKRCNALEIECIRAVKEDILPTLDKTIHSMLGPSDEENWNLSFEIDPATSSPVILFNYPTSEEDKSEYIQPQIKLEFGSLIDQSPFDTHEASSWVAEEFPDEFHSPHFRVVAINPERTFWEKATILHAEHHKPEEKTMRNRLSRDIYDLCLVASHDIGERALADFELLRRVVEFKMSYFSSRWANYEEAKPGTFQLIPRDYRISELKTDYRKMHEMFYEAQPEFDELLAHLQRIQDTINANPD